MIQKVYLDNNATTPLDESVKAAIIGSLNLWANPSSKNEHAQFADEAIQKSRAHLAQMFGVEETNQIIFTSGGTESNNWIIDGSIKRWKKSIKIDERPHIITSNIEHPSIMEPLKMRQENGEIDVTIIAVNPDNGQIRIDDVVDALTRNTCLITLMLANNETGVIQPVAEIFGEIRKKINNIDDLAERPICHSDVAQAAGKIPIFFNDLNADAITVVGHKFYGPRNGALVVAKNFSIPPMILGGGQENGRRSGTENTPLIVGLGEAARVFNNDRDGIQRRLEEARNYFEEKLRQRFGVGGGDKAIRFHFSASPRLPNTSSVALLEYASHGCDLVEKCQTFIASTGAACHKNECSPILAACQIPFNIASKTIRFSFGRTTTFQQIDIVVDELAEMCNK